MKRILILGSSGSGKTTLSKHLHDELGLPIINLDQYFWKPGWIREKENDFRKIVAKLATQDAWIMDGNYRQTLDLRLPYADTVILLDFSRFVCLKRILKRWIKNNRLDCIEGCNERINLEFLIWILWKYPQVSRKANLITMEEIKNDKEVFILKSAKDIHMFLSKLADNQ